MTSNPAVSLFVQSSHTCAKSIILVPGVGTRPCDSWFLSLPPWIEFLRGLDHGVTVHCYEHRVSYDEHFAWQQLFDSSLGLLAAIQRMRETLNGLQPLLYVCHGLGGAILKQALCVANVHFERYSQLLMSIGGIVFLGTPHRLEGGDNRHFGERVVSILKLEDVAGSVSRQGLSRLKETSPLLDWLASRFNRTNLRVDMLSVYEQRPTKTRDVGTLTLRSKVKKLIIIDKSLCTVGTSSEQCLGVDLDHL